MTRDCEHCEMLVSAWHDGELDRGGQVEMIDHLVRCAGCRDFYRDARGLDGLAAALREPATVEQPAPEIWRRIDRASRSRWPARMRGGAFAWVRRVPVPAWAAAAVAAVALVVLGSPLGPGRVPATSVAGGAAIRLGENPGGMDDERFVALTTSVLGADRKYREAFYQVMKQVVEDTGDREATREVFRPPGEERGSAGERGPAGERAPVEPAGNVREPSRKDAP